MTKRGSIYELVAGIRDALIAEKVTAVQLKNKACVSETLARDLIKGKFDNINPTAEILSLIVEAYDLDLLSILSHADEVQKSSSSRIQKYYDEIQNDQAREDALAAVEGILKRSRENNNVDVETGSAK